MKRLWPVLFLMPGLLFLTACEEEIDDDYEAAFVNPYPADDAVNINPGEHSYGSIDDIPAGILTEYGDLLKANGDNTFYWFDYNDDGVWQDSPVLTWETARQGEIYEIVYVGYDPDDMESFPVGNSHELQIFLLPDTTVYWQVRGAATASADESLFGVFWSFSTSGYVVAD